MGIKAGVPKDNQLFRTRHEATHGIERHAGEDLMTLAEKGRFEKTKEDKLAWRKTQPYAVANTARE